MPRARKEKSPTKIYTYGLLPPEHGGEDLMRMLRAGHNYRNALLEVERDRLAETEDFWAKRGRYTELVARVRELEAVRFPRKDDPRRQAHYDLIDDLREKVREKREATIQGSLPAEEGRRRLRSRELKAEAKKRGETLTKEQMTRLLDREPGCVSVRRKAQLDYEAQSRARGVEPSPKGMVAHLRALGLNTITQEIDDRATQKAKKAREHFKVYYGTYLLIEAQVERALEKTQFPRFKRWTGEGRVGAPVDTNFGLSVDSIHDCQFDSKHGWEENRGNTVLQIDPVGVSCAKGFHTRARVCVDSRGRSGSKRLSVWVDFRINYHRELPRGAKICGAWINIYTLGTRVKYELQLQVQDDSFQVQPRHGTGVAAINLGYRSSGRVAYVLSEDGKGRELLVSPRIEASIGRADTSRSDRENSANRMCDMLLGWSSELGFPEAFLVGDGESKIDTWSGSVTRRSRSLSTRISALKDAREESLSNKLRGILGTWAKLRQDKQTRPSDEATYAAFVEWFHQDKIYQNNEAFTRSGARNYRDQVVRDWAHELCDRYEMLLVDGTDYAKLKMRPKDKSVMPIENQTEIAHRRDNFAPGNLRSIIEEVARARGVTVDRHDPSGLTQRHHACGWDEPWDAMPRIEHKCAGCGETFDQDANFCVGLFERFRGILPPAPARSPRTSRKNRSSSGSERAGGGQEAAE